MRVIACLAVLFLVGVASATPRKHRAHKRGAHATARLHKHVRVHSPPPSASPADPLEPQLQITSPHAAVERAPEPPREAPPPPPQEASPPAQLDATAPPPATVARVDLTPRDGDAPPPAVLINAPTPRPQSHASDLHRQRRWGLFGGGLAMFLVGYGADIGVTYGLKHEPATTSLIPFAGPLLQVRESWALVPPSNTGNASIDAVNNQRIAAFNAQLQQGAYAVLAVDCAIQLIGTGLAIAGVVGKAPTKYASIEPGGGGLRVRF